MLPISVLKTTLSAENARLIDKSDSPIFPDAELKIYWRNIPRSAVDDCLAILSAKTWVTNFDNPANIYTVENPSIGLIPQSGLWRNVFAELKAIEDPKDEAKQQDARFTIYLTLHKGFADSITTAAGAMDWSGARLVDPGEYTLRESFEVQWPNLSGNVRKLARSVVATVTSPTIGGEEFTGAYVRKFARGRRTKDGSGIVTARFAVEPDALTTPESADRLALTSRTIGRYDTRAEAAAALVTAITATTGKNLSGSLSQTEEGYIATVTESVAQSLESANTSQETTASETVVSATSRNMDDAAEPPAPPTPADAVVGVITVIAKEKTSIPGKSTLTKTVRTAVKIDSGWITFPETYGTGKARILENATTTEIINAALESTTGLNVHVRPGVSQFPGKFSAHITANVIGPGGSAPAPSYWTNFNKEWAGFKSYTVGAKAYKVEVGCGVIQTNDKDTCAGYLETHHNTRWESINGGRHFRGTYIDILHAPTEIT